jgi:hypothetical protein
MSSANAFQARAVPVKELPLSEICKFDKALRKLPYEIRLDKFVEITGRVPELVRDDAAKACMWTRLPGVPYNRKTKVIYLVRTEKEEKTLGINGHSAKELKFDDCIDHNVGENTPIIFPEEEKYPYHIRLDMLAARIGVGLKLLEERAKEVGLAVNGVCDFESREDEIKLLYIKPRKKYAGPEMIRSDGPTFWDLEGEKLSGEEYKSLCEELEEMRPKTRADCENGERPCIHVSCRHHLRFKRIDPKSGEYELENPDVGLFERETCSLDVAKLGGLTLEEVGEILGGLTRERIRQVEAAGLKNLFEHPLIREKLEGIEFDYRTLIGNDSLKKGPIYNPGIRPR